MRDRRILMAHNCISNIFTLNIEEEQSQIIPIIINIYSDKYNAVQICCDMHNDTLRAINSQLIAN